MIFNSISTKTFMNLPWYLQVLIILIMLIILIKFWVFYLNKFLYWVDNKLDRKLLDIKYSILISSMKSLASPEAINEAIKKIRDQEIKIGVNPRNFDKELGEYKKQLLDAKRKNYL